MVPLQLWIIYVGHYFGEISPFLRFYEKFFLLKFELSKFQLFSSLVIPQILTFESNSSVLREGKSAWLNLELRGNTMYEVQWFHSGYLISNSTRRYKLTSFETQTNTSLHTLQINDVLKRDEGILKMWNASKFFL